MRYGAGEVGEGGEGGASPGCDAALRARVAAGGALQQALRGAGTAGEETLDEVADMLRHLSVLQ